MSPLSGWATWRPVPKRDLSAHSKAGRPLIFSATPAGAWGFSPAGLRVYVVDNYQSRLRRWANGRNGKIQNGEAPGADAGLLLGGKTRQLLPAALI